MHMAVHLARDFLTRRPLIDKPEDFPICPKGASRLNTCEPPPTLTSTLIQYPLEEGFQSAARDGLHYLGRILSYIFAVPLKKVSQQTSKRRQMQKYILMELRLDPVEEEDTAIAIILTFILRFVRVILLIEVVLWRVGIVLSSNPRQIRLVTPVDIGINVYRLEIWQIYLVVSVDIGINVRWLGIGVGLLLLLCIEAALDVRPIAVVGRAWCWLATPHIGLICRRK